MYVRFLMAVLAPALLSAQATSNPITVTAYNSSTAVPDQAIFSVSVTSGIGETLDHVTAAVASVGLTAVNLVSLGTTNTISNIFDPSSPPQSQPPMLQWTFQLVVPVPQVKTTTASLAALVKTIGQNNSGLSLSFSVQGTQLSPQAQTCDLAGLIANARTQAQSIANGAATTLGPISRITGAATTCSLTVQFGNSTQPSAPPKAITVTVSRPVPSAAPDQATIGLTITSPVTAGLDDITGALSAAGINGTTFQGVNTQTTYVTTGNQTQPQDVLAWSFTITVPLSALKDTLSQIVIAQQSFNKQNSTFNLAFRLEGAQSSTQSQPSCPEAGLVSDATLYAQKLGAAAGVSIGPILGLSSGPGAVQIATPTFRAGNFTSIVTPGLPAVGSVVSIPNFAAFPPASCSLTVQFQLGS